MNRRMGYVMFLLVGLGLWTLGLGQLHLPDASAFLEYSGEQPQGSSLLQTLAKLQGRLDGWVVAAGFDSQDQSWEFWTQQSLYRYSSESRTLQRQALSTPPLSPQSAPKVSMFDALSLASLQLGQSASGFYWDAFSDGGVWQVRVGEELAFIGGESPSVYRVMSVAQCKVGLQATGSASTGPSSGGSSSSSGTMGGSQNASGGQQQGKPDDSGNGDGTGGQAGGNGPGEPSGPGGKK
ncbi:MAG TPA: hypothetical protein PLF96_10190 [Thermotogota bacterium]|nr:hypothetical protein [Thermotogota bacterium]